MAPFAAHKPSGQHMILFVVAESNPEQGRPEWTEAQLAARSAELCGAPCARDHVGKALRERLIPKGLVFSRKQRNGPLLWAATAEARALPPFSRIRSR